MRLHKILWGKFGAKSIIKEVNLCNSETYLFKLVPRTGIKPYQQRKQKENNIPIYQYFILWAIFPYIPINSYVLIFSTLLVHLKLAYMKIYLYLCETKGNKKNFTTKI